MSDKTTTSLRLAEAVNFQALFETWEASESIKQRWRPYHKLPASPGSGCYMLLADFDSAKKPQSFEGHQLTGKRAFYFGRAGDTEHTDLAKRGRNYYRNSQAHRRVNQLVAALWHEQVPVMHMCVQMPVTQGKGVLEAMMLEKVDFCTNDKENGGYRPRRKSSRIFDDFARLCIEPGSRAQQTIEHSDFFGVSIGKRDQDSHVEFQLKTRALTVEVQEAYSAITAAAAESVADEHQSDNQSVCKNLDKIVRTAVRQLEEHLEDVDRLRSQLRKVEACEAYYCQLPPVFVASNSNSPAWQKSKKASQWQEEANILRRANHAAQQQSVSKSESTSSSADAVESKPLYSRIVEEFGFTMRQANNLKTKISEAVASGNIKDLRTYVYNIKGFTAQVAKGYASVILGDVPLGEASPPCKYKADCICHIAAQLVCEGSFKEASNPAVAKKIQTKSWYARIIEDLGVRTVSDTSQIAQAGTLRIKIADAASSQNIDDLWKYLYNFKGSTGERLRDCAERYATEMCGGEPLDIETYQPCVCKTQFVKYVAVKLVSEAGQS